VEPAENDHRFLRSDVVERVLQQALLGEIHSAVAPEGMPFCLDCLRRGQPAQCPAGQPSLCPAADKWLLENGR